MSQITLRGIDPKVEQEIRLMAQQSGKSLNRVVLDILYQNAGLHRITDRASAPSLRELAGGWQAEEAREFMDAIKPCRQIDTETWK